jgi:ribosome-binding protein aMBF1 (putative translation factor)
MNCYLCGLEAEQRETTQSGQVVVCRDCGEYMISDVVLRQLESRPLDFSKMRDDLHRQRQYNADSLAQINSETAIWA